MEVSGTDNSTLQINPATYLEQAVGSLEIILIITFSLWGIYSVLLSAHIYFLTWSKKGLGYLYPVSLLLLYILITAHTILSTLSFNWALTSDTMIKLSFDPSFWASAASQQAPNSKYMQFLRLNFGAELCYMIANLIADGILIWRCYRLWAGRKSVVAVPIVLYIVNGGFFVFGLFTEGSNEMKFDPPFLLGRPEGGVGVALAMSLAFAIGTIVTNLLLTALIAGRIFWLTKTTNGTSDHTTKKYPRLVAIFLESGLLYPLTVLIGICFLSVATPVELQPITAQTMGIAPTLMMVRVDLSASVEKAPEEFSTQHV